MIRPLGLSLLACIAFSSIVDGQSPVLNDSFRRPNQAVQNMFERAGYPTQPVTNDHQQFGRNPSGAIGSAHQGAVTQYYGGRGFGNAQFGADNILIINGQPVAAVQTGRGIVYVPVGINRGSHNYSTSQFRSRGSYRRKSSSKLGDGLYFGQ